MQTAGKTGCMMICIRSLNHRNEVPLVLLPYTVGPVLNARFNKCVLRFLPTLRIQ